MKAPRLSPKTLPFITKAGRQKKPDWLDRHRAEYEEAILDPLHTIARHLKSELAPLANGYHFPQRGLGRTKRTRDSAERYGSPFRSYFTYTAKRPAKSRFDHNPSIFFMVDSEDTEGDEVLLAGGLYMPSSRQLKSIRQAIETNAVPFELLFKSAAFAKRFPNGFSEERKSKRAPRGFDPNHPKIEWLKLQGYYVWRSYRKREYLSKDFGNLLVQDAKQILRLNDLLEQAIAGRWVTTKNSSEKSPPKIVDRIEGVTARREMDF